MKAITTIWIVALLSTVTPVMAWYSYDIFVLGHCDPKFGCMGSFQFLLFLYGTAAFIASLSFLASYYLLLFRASIKHTKKTVIVTIVAGSVLSALTPVYLRNSIGETPGMVIGWFAVSFVLSSIFYLVQKNITRQSRTPAKTAGLDRPNSGRPLT